jgi:hypothetical protein
MSLQQGMRSVFLCEFFPALALSIHYMFKRSSLRIFSLTPRIADELRRRK